MWFQRSVKRRKNHRWDSYQRSSSYHPEINQRWWKSNSLFTSWKSKKRTKRRRVFSSGSWETFWETWQKSKLRIWLQCNRWGSYKSSCWNERRRCCIITEYTFPWCWGDKERRRVQQRVSWSCRRLCMRRIRFLPQSTCFCCRRYKIHHCKGWF